MSNLTSDGRKVLDESDNDVRLSFCLDRCGQCYDQPFVVADGDLVTGNSYQDVEQKLGGSFQE